MTVAHSDALVFFGATGDLAYKQIFPALQAMSQRGRLDMPIIGVAKSGWNLDQLKDRACNSIKEHGRFDADAFAGRDVQRLRLVVDRVEVRGDELAAKIPARQGAQRPDTGEPRESGRFADRHPRSQDARRR